MQPRDSRGFSLVEALVASLILSSAIVGLAHLTALGAERSIESRRAAAAVSIAQSKLEELRRLAWTYALDGSRVTSPHLNITPPGTLDVDTPGYVNYVDDFGNPAPAPNAVTSGFACRWAIAPVTPADPDTVLLHACAFVVLGPTARASLPAACVSAIRTRQP